MRLCRFLSPNATWKVDPVTFFDAETTQSRPSNTPIHLSEIDRALTAQLAVAWAGENGEERRLGWWRTDLVSEFGGEDLFRRLLPHTWAWAVLQAAREAARREDASLRKRDHAPDRIVSLYSLGFDIDERIDERLRDLKQSGRSPQECLPGLAEVMEATWNRSHFADWLAGHGDAETTATSIGRRIKGDMPPDLDRRIRRLLGALLPLADSYPLPHFRND